MTLTSFSWIFSATALHIAAVIFVSYHCLIRRREANSALLWIFVSWSFPLIGFILFVFFGLGKPSQKSWEKYYADELLQNERRLREAGRKELVYWLKVKNSAIEFPEKMDDPAARSLNTIIPALVSNAPPLLQGNHISMLISGDEAYPRMLEKIAEARNHIHLQSFIIANDKIGRRFMDALATKARQGVRVKVLYDRLGSTKARWSGMFRKYQKIPNLRLGAWSQLSLFRREFQVNFRNHRKSLVIDGREAFVGGINIASQNVTDKKSTAIRDYHFHVQGPVVHDLQYVFLRDWHFMTEDSPADLLTPNHFPQLQHAGKSTVRVVNSGPTITESEAIANVFFSAITAARDRVMIITPYFVPFRDILQALRGAALRGVKVQVVVPRKNNHFYAGWAGRSVYEELLRAGVEVYEREPPFMHAKAMVVDQSTALIGTANFDANSLRLNYETNLAVFDQQLIYEIASAGREEIAASTRIELQEWLQRPTHRILLENFCGLMSPIL